MLKIHSNSLLTLSTLLAMLLSTNCLAKPLDLSNAIESVYVINSENAACATSFLVTANHLLTNSHVTEAICEFNHCSKVNLFHATELGARSEKNAQLLKIKALHDSPALDFTLFEIQQSNSLKPFFSLEKASSPKIGDKVYSIGFPNCTNLTFTEGHILGVNPTHVFTNLRSSHGSSGSPIFNESGDLIAIIDEANSILAGGLSYLIGTSSNSRGVRIDVINQVLSKPPPESLDTKADLLLKFYEDLTQLSGIKRLTTAISFISMTDGLKQEIVRTPSFDKQRSLIATLADYPSELIFNWQAANTKELEKIEQLVLAYNLELNGPYYKIFSALNQTDWLAKLNSSNRSKPQQLILENMLKSAIASPYRGLQIEALVLTLKLLLLTTIIFGFWTFSCGWAWAGISGGLLKRSLKLLLFAVTWPLSLAWLLFTRISK